MRIIDQLGHKRCQKKRKDMNYKLLDEFFQKYFNVHEQSAVEDSFTTYICYTQDGLCEFTRTNVWKIEIALTDYLTFLYLHGGWKRTIWALSTIPLIFHRHTILKRSQGCGSCFSNEWTSNRISKWTLRKNGWEETKIYLLF